MAQPPQSNDHLQGKILVRIELRHASGFLVLSNLSINLSRVRACIGPGIYQIFGTQLRIGC